MEVDKSMDSYESNASSSDEECPVCGKVFVTNSYVNTHLKNDHGYDMVIDSHVGASLLSTISRIFLHFLVTQQFYKIVLEFHASHLHVRPAQEFS